MMEHLTREYSKVNKQYEELFDLNIKSMEMYLNNVKGLIEVLFITKPELINYPPSFKNYKKTTEDMLSLGFGHRNLKNIWIYELKKIVTNKNKEDIIFYYDYIKL